MFLVAPPFFKAGSASPPFSASGSFETGDHTDGWSAAAITGSLPRTGSYSLVITGSSATKTFSAADVGGKDITFSIWVVCFGGGATTGKLEYQIGGGSYVEADTSNSGFYTELTAAFSNPGGNDVTFRISAVGGAPANFDDWSIDAV